jgi:hypothetical protein
MEAEGVVEVGLRGVRAGGEDRFVVTLATRQGRTYDFEFHRVPEPSGGHNTLAPEELRHPEGSLSSAGTFLHRVVGLFRVVVVTANVPVTALVGENPAGPLRLLYEDGEGGSAALVFGVPSGPLTPACVPLSEPETEQAAAIGLDAETVGRALYPFAMQLREPMEIIAP